MICCTNCTKEINKENVYCAHCGQKVKESKESLWRMLKDLFFGIFNLESKFFRSLGGVFIPAKLPLRYISGKRKSYLNPARFYLSAILIHFGILGFIVKPIISENDENVNISLELEKSIERKNEMLRFDSLAIKYALAGSEIDSLKKYVFEEDKMDLDSIPQIKLGNGIFTSEGDITGNKISTEDYLHMSPLEIYDKYEISGYWDQVMVRQSQRMIKNPTGMFNFFYGNSIWIVILLALAGSFFLKLLYFRKGSFLVEHFTVIIFYHSFLLILLSIVYLAYVLGTQESEVIGIGAGLSVLASQIYLYISLKRYYQQGYIKTFIKFALLNFYDMILLGFFFFIVGAISMYLF